jgi:hypothetical protein
MRLVSAHDLRTGAAFVLPGHARCVPAKAAHRANEVDQMIDRVWIDPSDVRPLSTCDQGEIVYVEWRAKRWIKLRVVMT